MRPQLLGWITLVLTLGLLIAACGGDDGGAPSPRPTAGVTSEDDNLGLPTMPTAPPLTPENGTPGGVGLTWYGQAMFELNSPRGADILMDPYGEGIGYRIPGTVVGITTVSHEHPDHNNADVGTPRIVLRGLADDGWAQIDERPTQDVRIRAVPSWHDDSEGSDRGRNAIFIFETGGLRIVHLGDLGHRLTQWQIEAIGPVDVLLVPVGGVFTIDAAGATEVVEQIGPRLVIPMHYKTETLTFQLEPIDAFLEGKEVERKGSAVSLDVDTLPPRGSGVIWVLEPAGAEE